MADDVKQDEPGALPTSDGAVKFPKDVKIKNNGIRHRIMHADHGYHTIEKGDTAVVPGVLAYQLLVSHDQFEAVDAPKEFVKAAEAERKSRKETADKRAKMLAEEAEEARKADEKTARDRGNLG